MVRQGQKLQNTQRSSMPRFLVASLSVLQGSTHLPSGNETLTYIHIHYCIPRLLRCSGIRDHLKKYASKILVSVVRKLPHWNRSIVHWLGFLLWLPDSGKVDRGVPLSSQAGSQRVVEWGHSWSYSVYPSPSPCRSMRKPCAYSVPA